MIENLFKDFLSPVCGEFPSMKILLTQENFHLVGNFTQNIFDFSYFAVYISCSHREIKDVLEWFFYLHCFLDSTRFNRIPKSYRISNCAVVAKYEESKKFSAGWKLTRNKFREVETCCRPTISSAMNKTSK